MMHAEEQVGRWLLRLLEGLVDADHRSTIHIEGSPGGREGTSTTFTFTVTTHSRVAFKQMLGVNGATIHLVRSLARRAARAHQWSHQPDVFLIGPPRLDLPAVSS